MAVGPTLKRLRVSRCLASHETAHLLDVSRSYYSRLEHGRVRPSLGLLERAALVYRVTVASILDGSAGR